MVYPKTIFVTGCAGFIASNFVKQFIKKFPKTKIIGIDDFSTGRKDALHQSVVFYEGTILDEVLLEKIFSKHKPEYVFHFAAIPRVLFSVKNPRLTSQVNIVGTVSLLEASRKHNVKRFIFSSSSSVYGGAKLLPTKESENFPAPKSPYAVQKYAGELFCKTYSKLFKLDTVCLRYFNVFGPGQYGNTAYSTVISAWLEALYFPSSKKAFIEGDGSQSRDFCYVDNVVLANILAMCAKKPLKGGVFNVANGTRTKVRRVKKLIEMHKNKKLELEKLPTRLGDVKHTLADVSKAQRVLGYKPTISFKEGLKLTVEWFESRINQGV